MKPSLLDDAIALAGALAEDGVQSVEYRAADADWQSLAARTTDLPGLIVAADDGFELRWIGGGARINHRQLKWWGVPGLPASPE